MMTSKHPSVKRLAKEQERRACFSLAREEMGLERIGFTGINCSSKCSLTSINFFSPLI